MTRTARTALKAALAAFVGPSSVALVKKRRAECRYWFAVPVAEVEATSRCPDCARAIRPTTAP